MSKAEIKSHLKLEERISTASISRCLEDDSPSDHNSLDESINDSFFQLDFDEPVHVQKIPSMKCALHFTTTSNPSSHSQSLINSIQSENLETLFSILKGPNKPNSEFTLQNGNTFLHVAAETGSPKICEALLDYLENVNINARNGFNMHPLHIAAQKGHLQVAQLLVRSGADINPVDLNGNSPIHLACINNHVQIVSWLLTRGPNLSLENIEGKKPIDLASEETKQYFLRFFRKTQIGVGPSLSEQSKIEALRVKVSSEVSLSSFAILQQLGKGSFGEVFLVKKIDNGELFAMKVLSKEKILGKNLTTYAMTERKVLSQLKHPFMVSLNYAFQTADNLFLILDYCPGGDLASHLAAEKRFTEGRARVYICEIILALEELHSRDIIFRDLKPDNIVLDAEGHAILTDFGLSKEGINEGILAKSFCGSIAYLAPEVLARTGHGKAVDWYLLGVLFYEMLVGVPPYFSRNKGDLVNNITKGKLKMPTFITVEAKELIRDLLQRDPGKRLGASRDAEEIKAHKFFRGVDWVKVQQKQLKTFKVLIPDIPKNGPSVDSVFGLGTGGVKVNGWSFVCN